MAGRNLREALEKIGHRDSVRYALGRWEALLRYCDNGQLEIDNKAAERALRIVALGRKNFLFAGSDGDGESAAAMYSLIGTAKLNGLDPESYLPKVVSRIADHPINRIEELLPWNVVAAAAAHSLHATAPALSGWNCCSGLLPIPGCLLTGPRPGCSGLTS
jgi:transposase